MEVCKEFQEEEEYQTDNTNKISQKIGYNIWDLKCRKDKAISDFNNIARVLHNQKDNSNSNLQFNIAQVNAIITGITTQKNINNYNKSTELWKRGKVKISTSKDDRDIICRVRGIVTKSYENKIAKWTGYKDSKKIDKIVKEVNSLYIAGCFDMYKIYKEENIRLRKEEGVNISNYNNVSVVKVKKPDIVQRRGEKRVRSF